MERLFINEYQTHFNHDFSILSVFPYGISPQSWNLFRFTVTFRRYELLGGTKKYLVSFHILLCDAYPYWLVFLFVLSASQGKVMFFLIAILKISLTLNTIKGTSIIPRFLCALNFSSSYWFQNHLLDRAGAFLD